MAVESVTASLGIEHAFLTATLLTGSSPGAEEALMIAIRNWDPAVEAAEDFLLRGAVEVSLRCRAFTDEESESVDLPDALRNVLTLPLPLRRCYVLRALMKWPVETCAELLHLTERQVQTYTGVAAARLAATSM